MAGGTDKAKGKAKETAGRASGNKRMEAEGKADQVKGAVKKTAGDTKGKADESMEALRQDDTNK